MDFMLDNPEITILSLLGIFFSYFLIARHIENKLVHDILASVIIAVGLLIFSFIFPIFLMIVLSLITGTRLGC